MAGEMFYDASEFSQFAVELRTQAPMLSRRLRSRIGKVGRASATKMRARVPHQDSTGNWGTLRGVRYSDNASARGGAIVIDHLAQTFGVGNRGPGRFKHPVFGKWSSSSKTISPISDFVEVGWAEVGTALELAADEAVQETIEELAFGGGSVESDLAGHF